MKERLSFPEFTDTDIVFGGYPEKWFQETLKKAEERDITGYGSSEYEKMFSKLFFHGGEIPINENLEEDYWQKGIRTLHAISRSFKPKHEHKTAVCALILESLCEKEEE